MGVTIHYQLGQKKEFIKDNLDSVEIVAKEYQKEAKKYEIPFEIKRFNDLKLFIDIGGCETLVFNFKPVFEIINKKDAWSYDNAVLTENGTKKLDADLFYTASFCKTQFCSNIIEHEFVANLIRTIASRCRLADVYDEGDYYHTGKIENASDNIKENGKMINGLMSQLNSLGYSKDNIITHKTHLKN